MALLRLLCFPSTSSFCTEQSLSFLQKPSSPSCCVVVANKPRRPKSLFTLHFSSSSSSSSATFTETPQLQSDTQQNAQQVQQQEGEEEEEVSRTRLLAQNVPWTSTPDDIRALFQKYGTVLDVELSMYNKTRNRGLAFVTMDSPEEALAALNNLESYEFEGRTLRINYARPRKKKRSPSVPTKQVSPYNLFVANLSYEARAKDLREFFDSGTGNVVYAEVVFHDNPRRSSGYGFVSFSSKEEAEAALSAFQGKIFMGRPIRVAHSKRFLKHEAKAHVQAKNTSIESNQDASKSDEADEIGGESAGD